MELLQVVEWATVVTTFLMFASGIPVCVSMCRTKNTKNVPFILFVVSVILSVIGLSYGLLTHNPLLTLINAVGTTLWAVYTFTYLYISKSKRKPVLQLVLGVGLLLAHFVYLKRFTNSHDELINQLGFFMFVWGNIGLLTPSLDIIDVIKEKSSDEMSLSLLFGGTLCSVTWLVYGYLIKDVYIYAPNIPGLVSHK
ncbi:sugar transporter SWEET1-like isoform X2 [Gigantopelta aegis]|uniref:sugar transporter SWEET1-like isoform X2 n=1 Tax=Gigantopelta aegis TaxID=1735272 RepID=UPI001B88AE3A|nr:sugar transporter SWEET1-like isoform X2 [Gigantopelta aegis]